MSKNVWKFHSQLPEATKHSSAVVFHNILYNIGGERSSHSLTLCHLSSQYQAQWKLMDLPNYDFKEYQFREVMTVENKIVYFGWYIQKTSFVLEEESERLKVVREDGGFDLFRGDWSTASRVLGNEIYAFKTRNYKEVHRYSLESGNWRLFYPSDWPNYNSE